MTIGTSIDYTVTRDDIITEALELLGVLAEGATPSAGQLTSCSRTLNLMVKAWQGEGLNLFALQRLYFFPDLATHEYLTSTWKATTSYTKTGVSEASAALDTTIKVDSITGITNGDIIGIELDTGAWHWTTVNGVPSGVTVTITTGVPSAVAIGNYVVAFTTRANRPMKIVDALRRDLESNSDTPIDVLPRERYITLTPKTVDGPITQIYYDPQISPAKLFTWPETDSIHKILILYAQKTLADLDAAGDNPEFPQEWLLALSTNLAKELLPKFGSDTKRASLIINSAGYYKSVAESFDTEELIQFVPKRI